MSLNTPEGRGVGEARWWYVLGGLGERVRHALSVLGVHALVRWCPFVTISVYERAKSWRLELE